MTKPLFPLAIHISKWISLELIYEIIEGCCKSFVVLMEFSFHHFDLDPRYWEIFPNI